jgi:hypothetical protein
LTSNSFFYSRSRQAPLCWSAKFAQTKNESLQIHMGRRPCTRSSKLQITRLWEIALPNPRRYDVPHYTKTKKDGIRGMVLSYPRNFRQRDIPIRAPAYTNEIATKITRGGSRRRPRTVVAVETITGETAAASARNCVTLASAAIYLPPKLSP